MIIANTRTVQWIRYQFYRCSNIAEESKKNLKLEETSCIVIRQQNNRLLICMHPVICDSIIRQQCQNRYSYTAVDFPHTSIQRSKTAKTLNSVFNSSITKNGTVYVIIITIVSIHILLAIYRMVHYLNSTCVLLNKPVIKFWSV